MGSNQSKRNYEADNEFEEFDKFYKSLGLDKDHQEIIDNEFKFIEREEIVDQFNLNNNNNTRSSDPDYWSTCLNLNKPPNQHTHGQKSRHYEKNVMKNRGVSCFFDSSINFATSIQPYNVDYQHENRDCNRDDASFLNQFRRRSNSLSTISNLSLLEKQQQSDSLINPLILPSPTTADYLRNKTRENALYNHVLCTPDYELSQILYDDMAYRQLRKDSEAHKLSQLKNSAARVNNVYGNNIKHIGSMKQLTTEQQMKIHHQHQQQQQSMNVSLDNLIRNNLNENNTTSTKKIKMIKQKDRFLKQNISNNGFSINDYI